MDIPTRINEWGNEVPTMEGYDMLQKDGIEKFNWIDELFQTCFNKRLDKSKDTWKDVKAGFIYKIRGQGWHNTDLFICQDLEYNTIYVIEMETIIHHYLLVKMIFQK